MILRDDIGIDIKYDHKSLSNYKRVTPGQFVIHLRSFQGGFADSQMEGITSPAYTVLDFKEKDQNHSLFWKEILTSQSFIKRLETVTYGIRDGRSISFSDFSTLKFLVPRLDEQLSIANLFSQLDQIITLHQQKYDSLRKLKQAYLNLLFPEKNEKVPQVRFADFKDEWGQLKLGEVANFLNGRAYKQQELLDSGQYRVLRVGNFNTNDRWYYSDLELEENKYAQKGDLLYLWATNFGPEIWSEERVIYHYHIWKLQLITSDINQQYLYTWLLTDKERIKQKTNGTTMVHVTKGNMEQREFQYPINITEQQKIGSFFKYLDDTISLHEQKLDSLKQLKQAYLQKMFV